MGKRYYSILLIFLLLIIYSQIVESHEIYLKNGKVIESKLIHDNGDTVTYYQYGIKITIDKKTVDKILYKDEKIELQTKFEINKKYIPPNTKNDYSSTNSKESIKKEQGDNLLGYRSTCDCQCSKSGKINEHLTSVDFYTLSISELFDLSNLNKMNNVNNFEREIVKARTMAEGLLSSKYFSDKYGQVETYYNKILEVIPCLYYSECIPVFFPSPPYSTPRGSNKDFYEKVKAISVFIRQYEKTWMEIRKKTEEYKMAAAKESFENEIANSDKDNSNLSLSDNTSIFKEGVNYFNNKMYLEAIDLFTKCINANYNVKDSCLYRGQCYYCLCEIFATKKETENRFKLANFAKSDFNQSISLGEDTGLAYIGRAKLNWMQFGNHGPSVLNDLDKVISGGYKYAGMALYWKAIYYKWDQKYVDANVIMIKSADAGYSEAVNIISENPIWPNK